MFKQKGMARSRHGQAVPTDVYISLVDALYRDPRSPFIGSIAASIATLLTALRTGEVQLFVCASGIALVACLRALDMRAFARNRPWITTAEAARRWELRYVIGSSASCALFGTWCLVAFARTSDPLVHLVSFSATIAYMIGISGRNFAIRRLVAAQIVCAGVPITIALFLMGSAYYIVFAFVLLPFFVSLVSISDRLRGTLLDAVIAARDNTVLAKRFDTALNNMPHGLCMFDAERRLAVSNRRLTELLGVMPDVARRGDSIEKLLRDCVRAGTLLGSSAERLASQFEDRLSGRADGNVLFETQDGRTINLTFQPMESGGSVVLAEDITERRNSEAKIRHLARYDMLTELPNRTFLHDRMEHALVAMPQSDLCAVLFVDLDDFKQVNDTLGHPCGDELLRAVAARLRGLVRASDIVARFGGDEFVVLQSPLRHSEDAASLAGRIIERLAEAYEIDGHDIAIGASVGVAMAPRDGVDADLLLKKADMALYCAKADGRGQCRFFEPEMDVKAQARRSLELDIRNALATDAFEVWYQPLINLKSHRVTTCEALLRWPHPERGMVSPAEFIPVAEEMGLIVELGNRVLHKACTECMKWPADVRVSVNLSAIQFRRGNVLRAIREALAASGLSPSRLEVEITESVLIHDTEAARACLQQLRDFGVRVSLDDFGTGYSSLSYLHSFPLTKVKIDRSFLKGIGDDERSLTLLHGVARLSAELGMTVVVEGVETEAQLALIMREESIDEVQGFLFSKAVPGPQVRALLDLAPSRMEKVA